jgi:hypothetical protein
MRKRIDRRMEKEKKRVGAEERREGKGG